MRILLNPEKIYQKFLKKELNESEVVEFLIPFLESSEDITLRIKSLEVLNKLDLHDYKSFKILESFLISDENEIIRTITAEIIIKSFFTEGLKSLKWIIKKDNSPMLLNKIKNLLENEELNVDKILLKELYKKLNHLASVYKLTFKELPLLLDLNVNLNGKNLYQINSMFNFIYERNFMCTIIKGHINELSMSLYNELPETIGFLSKLEHLNLSCNYLNKLPDSLSNLKLLKTLDLSWNDFLNIPEIIKRLRSVEIIDMSHNKIKILPPWISLLKNLVFLNLESNDIKEIPNSIKMLKNLKFFYI